VNTVRTPRRHIACDGAFNLRDLGGYTGADGRTVRWDVLFRADSLHRDPAATIRTGTHLGWRTVLDLRTADEVALGRFEVADVELLHLPVLRETWIGLGLDEVDDVAAFLTERYLEMLEVGSASLRTAVEVLAADDRVPAVFHCSAGKDRTGVLAALLLAVLGVTDDDIAADYHLSALAMGQMVEWMRTHQPEMVEVMAQHPQAFLECPPQAMYGFLGGLRDRFGSADGYLREAGVPADAVDRLRHHHLVP
jgi:protein-tyrosine phosphatase